MSGLCESAEKFVSLLLAPVPDQLPATTAKSTFNSIVGKRG
jgi:hypothetical protein